MEDSVFTMINKQNGNLAFKLFEFNDNSHFDYVQRHNFYSLIWIKEGKGLLKVDFSEYHFSENNLFSFAPYQPFMFSTEGVVNGVALQFHSDFYCIHRNPKETNCDTTLFNNIYEKPFFIVDKTSETTFRTLIEDLKTEFKHAGSDNYELLIPYLKIFLVTATRQKLQLSPSYPQANDAKIPFILNNLKNAIEHNFRIKHSASDYAALLDISPNALAKIVKTNLNKTLTELITERIIVEAKRELYFTNKSVKEIAYHLGYADEFYFSRVFKQNTDISPQMYRETVGFGKAENLN